MRRKTSDEAYRQIRDNGLLTRRRLQAYQTLFLHGPLTGSELDAKAGSRGLWKRLSELQALRVVEVVGKKRCTVSSVVALLWDVTSELPAARAKDAWLRCKWCQGKGKVRIAAVQDDCRGTPAAA